MFLPTPIFNGLDFTEVVSKYRSTLVHKNQKYQHLLSERSEQFYNLKHNRAYKLSFINTDRLKIEFTQTYTKRGQNLKIVRLKGNVIKNFDHEIDN